jgi:glycosyltransferase A (GT-A) superfamily protein (DUF2064 family)
MDLLVLAKEPRPGRVKTRLTPPCTPPEAAALAEAALADTLAVALASGATRVVLGLEGAVGGWCPPGVVVVPQGAGDLARRLGALWAHAGGPALQIGMDTPQVTPALLDEALALLEGPADAALGLAVDGGWWAVGMGRPRPGAFAGVAASRPDTGVRQLQRLLGLGLRVASLPVLRDVDHWSDVVAVTAEAPGTRFAATARSVTAAMDRRGVRRPLAGAVG